MPELRVVLELDRQSARTGGLSRRVVVAYSAVCVGAILLAIVTLHLWHADWNIPFYYGNGGDALFTSQLVHAMRINGWFLDQPQLAAPFGAHFQDFPIPNVLHLAILKILTIVLRGDGLALNVYFVAFFPLTAFIAFAVLRRLGVTTISAAALALVYTILPYRFMRNEAHLFYAGYYCAPLLVLTALFILRNVSLFDTQRWRPTTDGYVALAAAVLLALDNQYFVLFAGVLFVASAAVAVFRYRRWQPIAATSVLLAMMFVCFVVNVAPVLLYERAHGADATAVTRTPEAAEIYGLTLAQLVLPIPNHRFAKFAHKRAFYDSAFPLLANENGSVSLGIIGSLGFLASLVVLMLFGVTKERASAELGFLNVIAFFLATVGGFGALLTYYVTDLFRAYNRIAPIIGFASLGVVAVFADRARFFYGTSFRRRLWIGSGIIALVAFATYDQSSNAFVPPYQIDRTAFLSDEALANEVQTQIPRGMVFQLPYVRFPESPPVVQLGSWDELAVGLHTSDVGWSFGATSGRYPAFWMESKSSEQPSKMLADLLLAGFDGIAVYRKGYADGGQALCDQLSALTGGSAYDSNDGTVALFTFPELAARARALFGNGFDAARNLELYQPVPEFADGFYSLESDGTRTWRWASTDAVIKFNNPGGTRNISLHFTAVIGAAGTLTFSGPGSEFTLPVAAAGTVAAVRFTIPAGASEIRIHSSIPARHIGSDPRSLAFQLYDLRFVDESMEADRDRVLTLIRRSSVLPPSALNVQWGGGFSAAEASNGSTWHWSSEHGRLTIQNLTGQAARLRIRGVALSPNPGSLIITIGAHRTSIATDGKGVPIDLSTVIRGRKDIEFADNASPLVAPSDPRRLVFQLRDLRVVAQPLSTSR